MRKRFDFTQESRAVRVPDGFTVYRELHVEHCRDCRAQVSILVEAPSSVKSGLKIRWQPRSMLTLEYPIGLEKH
jgi:hypothetical protein